MKNFVITLGIIFFCISLNAQSVQQGIPDSVINVSHPNSNGSYTISNP